MSNDPLANTRLRVVNDTYDSDLVLTAASEPVPHLALVNDTYDSDVEQAVSQIADVMEAAEDAVDSVSRMRQTESTTSNAYVKGYTRTQMADIGTFVDKTLMDMGPLVDSDAPAAPWLTRLLFRMASKHPGRLAKWWTPLSMMLTAFVMAAIAADLLVVGFAFLLIRVLGSVFIAGGPYALLPPLHVVASADRTIAVRTTGAGSAIIGCFFAHLTDVAVMAAIACNLYLAGHPGEAMVVMAFSTMMVMGTLARVAPAQIGQIVSRSPWERTIRLGGILAALAIGSFTHRFGGYSTVMLAAVPAGLFGTWETVWMLTQLKRQTHHLGSVRILAILNDGTPVSTRYGTP